MFFFNYSFEIVFDMKLILNKFSNFIYFPEHFHI